MPDDGMEFTCKHLLVTDTGERECWKFFKMRPCVPETIDKMEKCKEFKKVMKW